MKKKRMTLPRRQIADLKRKSPKAHRSTTRSTHAEAELRLKAAERKIGRHESPSTSQLQSAAELATATESQELIKIENKLDAEISEYTQANPGDTTVIAMLACYKTKIQGIEMQRLELLEQQKCLATSACEALAFRSARIKIKRSFLSVLHQPRNAENGGQLHVACFDSRLFLRRKNLPSSARDVLMDWLRTNLEHPYPSTSQKMDLASRAGISVEQCTNWYINARVRLVKKMRLQRKEEGSSYKRPRR